MDRKTITISEVIELMDSGMPFDLIHVTASETKGTGGIIKERRGWVICREENLPEPLRFTSKEYRALKKTPEKVATKQRLILHPATRQVRAVHLRLICSFNGLRVV